MGCGDSLNPVKAAKKAWKETKRAGRSLDKRLNLSSELKNPSLLTGTPIPDKLLKKMDDPLSALTPEMPAPPATAEAPIYPAMDPEEIRRERRRRASGAASTILSQSNQDGLGG